MLKRRQRTIKDAVSLKGAGLHTGTTSRITFQPAPPDTGIIMRRVDVETPVEINTATGSILHRARRTTMSHDDLQACGVEIQTVEHLLSTLKGLRIDNLFIDVDNIEIPGMDGSAKPFADALYSAGVVDQEAYAVVHELRKPIYCEQGDVSLIAIPCADGFRVSYTLDYKELTHSSQYLTVDLTPDIFISEIAPARTFCMRSEVEILQQQGLGKGANTQNTLVMDGDRPVDNEFRFPDELVRHKILDLIGDLFLIGADVNMHVIAVKSGHSSNVVLAERIKAHIHNEHGGLDVVYDYEEIKKILPHRYPFLLVDKIIELEPCKRIVGVKNVTATEGYFQGHFPERAVMPGVLQIEAMAQTAGIIFLVANQETDGKIPMLLTVDKVKLRRPVVPGDQLRIEVDVLHMKPTIDPKRGSVSCKSFVGNDVVSEAEIKFIMVDGE